MGWIFVDDADDDDENSGEKIFLEVVKCHFSKKKKGAQKDCGSGISRLKLIPVSGRLRTYPCENIKFLFILKNFSYAKIWPLRASSVIPL